jgi:hypothetical protein
MNINFTPTVPSTRQAPHMFTRETIESGDAFVDVSSVMEDVGGDNYDQDTADDSQQQQPTSSIASRSSISSSSTSSSSVDLIPRFERAMEHARQVVFTPHNPIPKVHEFDWKVVDFQPTQTAGHKRNWTSMDEEDVCMTDGPSNSASNQPASVVSSVSSSSSASSTSFEKPQRRRFWKGSSKKQNSDSSNEPSNNNSSSDFSAQGSFIGSNIRTSNSTIPTISNHNPPNQTKRGIFPFRNFLGSSATQQYTRPAKRTRVEATYHLGPSADHGILKNRTTSPDAISTPKRFFADRRGHFPSTYAMPPPQPPPPRQRTSTSTKKRIRFVDSRMKVVKRLQSGNLFSFGGGTGYEELDEDDDYQTSLLQSNQDEDNGTSFAMSSNPVLPTSPPSSARTIRRLQVGTFSSDTMAEF